MRPVGWSKRSVQLECESCGAHNRVEFLPYLSAVEAGAPLECGSCGARAIPRDRRSEPVAPSVQGRVAIPA